MQTIRKRLGILFVVASISAIILIALFVNMTISNKFNQYMIETQKKREERIVSYLEEIYKRKGQWSSDAGMELIHEADMNNYCLTLLDVNKKVIWGMDPSDIRDLSHLNSMYVKDRGIYTSKVFEIKSEGNVVGYIDIGQYSSVLLSEEDAEFKTSINTSIVASGVITLLIVVIISLYFSKQFSIPIKEVVNMSVELSKGKFETKSVTESNIEELEDLRRSINILGEKLKNQDLLRKRLVSDISHEIRTPLNVLQNNLEAMIDGVFPVTTERLNYLNEEVMRFGKLLDNLNTLKDFEDESIKLNFEEIPLDKLINDVYKEFYTIAEAKQFKLNYYIKPNEKYNITGDRDKLKQVFINLLSNAIKFNKAHGNISIRLLTDDKNIIVEIEDDGIGIKKEDLDFIFERLYRGDKSRHEIEGSGIGLTVVKNILQLHSASISVDSKEGKGSTFKVFFNKFTRS